MRINATICIYTAGAEKKKTDTLPTCLINTRAVRPFMRSFIFQAQRATAHNGMQAANCTMVSKTMESKQKKKEKKKNTLFSFISGALPHGCRQAHCVCWNCVFFFVCCLAFMC